MAYGLADGGRLIRPMERITLAREQAVGAQDPAEFALVGAERRDHDVASRDDFPPLPRLEGVRPAVGILFHDVVAVDGDGAPVRRGELLTSLELLDPQPALFR